MITNHTLEIKEINNKEIWEKFLLNCDAKTFLQSWNWGEFQKLEGNKIWRIGIYDENPNTKIQNPNLLGVALIIKISARRGIFLSCPHGPAIKSQIINNKLQVVAVFEKLLERIKEIAKKEKAIFLRLSPILDRTEENINIFKKVGFHDSPIHLHPDLTWELNLQPPEEELLMNMRKTHRYLIRKADKDENIKIEMSRDIKDIDSFNDVYKETSGHHHFVPYSINYLKNEFKAFSPDDQIAVYLGRYQGKLAAAAIIVFWQDLVVYHHGATSLKYSKFPTAYFMQWEIIKEAKRRGCKNYNFWGIAPKEAKNHPWQGFTLFKQGFGGYKREFVKTQDIAFSKRYVLTYIFEKIRKMKRRL